MALQAPLRAIDRPEDDMRSQGKKSFVSVEISQGAGVPAPDPGVHKKMLRRKILGRAGLITGMILLAGQLPLLLTQNHWAHVVLVVLSIVMLGVSWIFRSSFREYADARREMIYEAGRSRRGPSSPEGALYLTGPELEEYLELGPSGAPRARSSNG